jgi:hypothetical protein
VRQYHLNQMISVTLKSHTRDRSTNNTMVPFGSSIQSFLDTINKYREDGFKINKLYNQKGRQIPPNLMNVSIKENLIFYIDQPK